MGDPVKALAKHAVQCRYEDVSAEGLRFAKMSFLDTLGTIIAGATAPGCQAVAERVLDWGGKPESSLFMYAGRVPAQQAALVNAVMARAMDFDDSMDPGLHLSAAVIPAGLAMAERVGGVSGREFLAALAIAEDIGSRINSATGLYHGFDPTLVASVYATTAIAGRLTQLNEEQMTNALGLAFNESSGSFQSNIDGVLSVRFNQGLGAQAGIVCAEFAQDGLTGVVNVFNGVYGFFNLFSRGTQQAEHLTRDLGKTYYNNTTVYKRFPSCGCTLSATDSTLHLMQQHPFVPQDVARIIVRAGRHIYNLVGSPFKIGANPVVDAQFNVRYTVANAIARQYPKLTHFTPAYIKDEALRELIAKVEVVLETEDPRFDTLAAEVTIILNNGEQFTHMTPHWKGHPLDPLSMEDIVPKFRDNVTFSSAWFDVRAADDIVQLALEIESCPDITTIIPYLKLLST